MSRRSRRGEAAAATAAIDDILSTIDAARTANVAFLERRQPDVTIGVIMGGVKLNEDEIALISDSIIQTTPLTNLLETLHNWCAVSGIICGERVWRSAMRAFGVTANSILPYSTWRSLCDAVREDVRKLPEVRRAWLDGTRDWSPRQLDLAADEMRLREMPGLGWVARSRGGDFERANVYTTAWSPMERLASDLDIPPIRDLIDDGVSPTNRVLYMALHRGHNGDWAKNARSAAIVRLVLRHGANANGQKAFDPRYAEHYSPNPVMLDMAIHRENEEAIRVLLEYGAVISERDRAFAKQRGIERLLEQPRMA